MERHSCIWKSKKGKMNTTDIRRDLARSDRISLGSGKGT